MQLEINIAGKIARFPKYREEFIVCGNSDYTIAFTFDAEWDGYHAKTARFSYNGKHIDVPFTGNVCKVPALYNTKMVEVGVYAGDIKTTTSAQILCKKGALCDAGTPEAPEESVYNSIMDLIRTHGVNDVHNITSIDTVYNDLSELPTEGVSNGTRWVALTNGKTPLVIYSYDALTGEWSAVDTCRGSVAYLVLTGEKAGIYRYTMASPHLVSVESHTLDEAKEYTDEVVAGYVPRKKNSQRFGRAYVERSNNQGVTTYFVGHGPIVTDDRDVEFESIPLRSKAGVMRCTTTDSDRDDACTNKAYVEGKDAVVLKQAQTYSDNKDTTVLTTAKNYAAQYADDKTAAVLEVIAKLTREVDRLSEENTFLLCGGVTLPAVETLTADILADYTSATAVYIPNTVTAVDADAFDSLTKVVSVYGRGSAVALLRYTALQTQVTSLRVTETVPERMCVFMSTAIFEWMSFTQLKDVTIMEGVKTIGKEAFLACTALERVSIPSSVKEIGNEAFFNCGTLTIVCKALTPPTLASSTFSTSAPPAAIYVPAESVDAYKKANGWSDFADIIQAIE